jgi:hypothetical protein
MNVADVSKMRDGLIECVETPLRILESERRQHGRAGTMCLEFAERWRAAFEGAQNTYISVLRSTKWMQVGFLSRDDCEGLRLELLHTVSATCMHRVVAVLLPHCSKLNGDVFPLVEIDHSLLLEQISSFAASAETAAFAAKREGDLVRTMKLFLARDDVLPEERADEDYGFLDPLGHFVNLGALVALEVLLGHSSRPIDTSRTYHPIILTHSEKRGPPIEPQHDGPGASVNARLRRCDPGESVTWLNLDAFGLCRFWPNRSQWNAAERDRIETLLREYEDSRDETRVKCRAKYAHVSA